MTRKVVSCYILDRNHKITIDLCDTNTIYDKSGNHEVPFDLLTFDHLRKLIWSDIKSNEEDINGAKQLKLWLGEKSKELEKNFRDGVYEELDPTDKLSTNIFQFGSIIIVQPLSSPEHIQKKRKLWHKDPKETSIIHGSNNEVRQIPVSQSEFKLVRENHLLYVDKTFWLSKLDLNTGQYFVSRPRKFGKSMFLSMIESFFLVQHDLFKDLYIYQNPPEIYVKDKIKEWNKELDPIPVIRLDFSELTSNKGPDVLEVGLIQMLRFIGESYGVNLKYNDSVKDVTKELITTLAGHEENVYKKVVILIDEYDSPILSVFNATKESLKIADENREVLKGFFEIIKSSQQKIKFCLVTGVTMFSNMQLFSGANQLVDLTLSDKLSGAYGFANKEIETTFESKFLGEYSNVSETMNKLKEKYNGYSWDGNIRVYNPFSICSFFYGNKLENFWVKKGRTSFLAKLVRLEHIKDIAKHEIRINRDCMTPVSIENIQNSSELPVSLFFQTGYLTIKKVEIVNKETEYLILAIPNSEVRNSLMGELWANTFCIPVENAFRRIITRGTP
ncbi:DUF1703-domain-containing protein [Rhizophagus irregularis]|uniref:DUF1703-domain-containing protein n=1 Tax=Rhizophagus irregularis TaxID=588596 RepID=A0A2N1MZ33_9GLOM|nr:DUF1703-domain-containing protein [Rhizophagus irregularis]